MLCGFVRRAARFSEESFVSRFESRKFWRGGAEDGFGVGGAQDRVWLGGAEAFVESWTDRALLVRVPPVRARGWFDFVIRSGHRVGPPYPFEVRPEPPADAAVD